MVLPGIAFFGGIEARFDTAGKSMHKVAEVVCILDRQTFEVDCSTVCVHQVLQLGGLILGRWGRSERLDGFYELLFGEWLIFAARASWSENERESDLWLVRVILDELETSLVGLKRRCKSNV